MNVAEFGALLKALRTRKLNATLETKVTQEGLARVLGYEGDKIIRDIERGRRRIKEDELLKLADFFRLTSRERQQLFDAARNIDADHTFRQKGAAEKILIDLRQKTAAIRLPSFVVDNYFDVITLNPLLTALFNIDDLLLNELGTVPAGYNLMTFLFSPKTKKLRGFLSGDEQKKTLVRNIRVFRGLTLQYRATHYYHFIYREISKYNLFRELWNLAYEEDEFLNQNEFDYYHRKWGHLRYLSTISGIPTAFGDLYQVIYVPMNSETLETFAALPIGGGAQLSRLLAPWPDKVLPE